MKKKATPLTGLAKAHAHNAASADKNATDTMALWVGADTATGITAYDKYGNEIVYVGLGSDARRKAARCVKNKLKSPVSLAKANAAAKTKATKLIADAIGLGVRFRPGSGSFAINGNVEVA